MVFALVRRNGISDVRGQRVHLTLPKPLSPALFGKGLRAAYSTMAQERRASLHYAVEAEASLAELTNKGEHQMLAYARVLNISRTGMCLETKFMLPQNAGVHVSFNLPQNGGLVDLAGTVVWAKSSGQSGIKFTNVSGLAQKRLEDWLQSKVPNEFVV